MDSPINVRGGTPPPPAELDRHESCSCFSKSAIITVVAVGIILGVGLCFINPIGLGVGLGIGLLALILLTTLGLGCCSSRAVRVNHLYQERRPPPPSIHVVDLRGAGHLVAPNPQRLYGAGAPPPPAWGSSDRSGYLLSQQPQSFSHGSRAVVGGSGMSTAAAPPPPKWGGLDRQSSFEVPEVDHSQRRSHLYRLRQAGGGTDFSSDGTRASLGQRAVPPPPPPPSSLAPVRHVSFAHAEEAQAPRGNGRTPGFRGLVGVPPPPGMRQS